jgi:hypothetical protein
VAAHPENSAKPPLRAQTGCINETDRPSLTFLMARPRTSYLEGAITYSRQTEIFPKISVLIAAAVCRPGTVHTLRHCSFHIGIPAWSGAILSELRGSGLKTLAFQVLTCLNEAGWVINEA